MAVATLIAIPAPRVVLEEARFTSALFVKLPLYKARQRKLFCLGTTRNWLLRLSRVVWLFCQGVHCRVFCGRLCLKRRHQIRRHLDGHCDPQNYPEDPSSRSSRSKLHIKSSGKHKRCRFARCSKCLKLQREIRVSARCAKPKSVDHKVISVCENVLSPMDNLLMWSKFNLLMSMWCCPSEGKSHSTADADCWSPDHRHQPWHSRKLNSSATMLICWYQ